MTYRRMKDKQSRRGGRNKVGYKLQGPKFSMWNWWTSIDGQDGTPELFITQGSILKICYCGHLSRMAVEQVKKEDD